MIDNIDLIVRNASHVLSMDPGVGDLRHADIAVAGGRIVAVGASLPVPVDADVLDASGCIVIPGFVDTHRHLFQAIVRGCAPHHTLSDYFVHVLGSIAPALSPQELGLGNRLGAHAALAAGVTTVQDISNVQDSAEITDELVTALQDSGLRAVFAYGKSFPAARREGSGLPADARRVRRDLLADDDALVTMALLTEPGDDEAELANAALAAELDVRTARHSAARNPITRLARLGALRPGTTFIHGNGHLREDLQLITDHGGSLSVSPAIEMVMGHGYPVLATTPDDLPISLSADVEVTVGADMFTKLRAALQAARSQHHIDPDGAPREITVADVLGFATVGGARALGLDDRIGSIAVGKRADLVVLRADGPGVAPVTDPYSAVVLQMDRQQIDTVLVDGRVVVRDGRLLADTTALVADAERVVERLAGDGVLAYDRVPA